MPPKPSSCCYWTRNHECEPPHVAAGWFIVPCAAEPPPSGTVDAFILPAKAEKQPGFAKKEIGKDSILREP